MISLFDEYSCGWNPPMALRLRFSKKKKRQLFKRYRYEGCKLRILVIMKMVRILREWRHLGGEIHILNTQNLFLSSFPFFSKTE
jgi:hypothetical protein